MLKNEKNDHPQKSVSTSARTWKIAFLTLLGVVLGSFAWLGVHLFSPSSQGTTEPPATSVSSENLSFEVRSDTKQIEQLANQYLQKEMETDTLSYSLYLAEHVTLVGNLELFGVPIPLELELDPYVMEDGNLQLKARSFSLGALNLPLSFIMNQLDKQFELPKWVSVHAESEYLIVHFDEFALESGVHFSMTYINLAEDDLRMNVYVPTETTN